VEEIEGPKGIEGDRRGPNGGEERRGKPKGGEAWRKGPQGVRIAGSKKSPRKVMWVCVSRFDRKTTNRV